MFGEVLSKKREERTWKVMLQERKMNASLEKCLRRKQRRENLERREKGKGIPSGV